MSFQDLYWQPAIFQKGSMSLPYQLFIPESTGTPLPLVIFLHGTGESGTDNTKQLYAGTGIGSDYFAESSRQASQPCYILAPQTPESIRWASTSLAEYDLDHTPITSSMELLLELIDQILERYPIDLSRVYIGGMSRGGQGAWNACFRRPELFAAAYMSCCSGSPRHAHLVKDIPLWIFHGDADDVTSVEFSRNMIEGLRPLITAPDRLRYTEIPGGDHGSGWLVAHKSNELHTWLFSFPKKSA